MKKFYLVFLALITMIFGLTACKKDDKGEEPEKENSKPVINAPAEVSISVGERFNVYNYVESVTDLEDGDLKESLDYEGQVEISQAGDYTITLVVRDSAGAEVTKEMVVHVVAKDEKAPSITGASNVDVVVGRTFDPKEGVKAIDTVDGDVSDNITVTGTVDTDHVGTYTLNYSVSDASGNEAKATRTVNVTTGPFIFNAEDIMTTEKVIFTHNEESTVSYDLVKVDFTCDEGATVTVKLGSKEVSTVVSGAEGATYFAFEEAPTTELDLVVTGGTLVGWTVGDAADAVAPVITGNFENAIPISKDTKDAAIQYVIDMSGAKAQDDRDGYITNKLTLDVEGINWDIKDEQDATLKVSDLAGNVATKTIKVIVNGETELADLGKDLDCANADGGFDGAESANYYRGGSIEKVTDGTDMGSYKITLDKGGGFWSSSMVRFNLTQYVTEGNYYIIKLTARCGLEESEGQLTQGISYRIGGQLAADPWYYEFTGCSVSGSTYGENRMNLTSEYQTIYRIFKADYRVDGNYDDVIACAMEFHFGSQDYNTLYPVYIKEFSISLLSNEDQAPQVFINSSLPTVVVSGATIDLSQYATATDVEDGTLQVTVEGSIGTEAGIYPVKFIATDSKGHKTEKTIEFEVLTEEDTEAPVITFKGANPLEVNVNAMSNEDAFAYLLANLEITDKKNGVINNIPVTADMITGSVDLTKAGKYKVTVACGDSSGNESTLVIVVKVQEEQQSNDELIGDLSGTIGTKENITAEINDGVIEILPTTFENGYWGSFNKSKYGLPSGVEFEVGKTYKLVITAKADEARDIKASLVAHDSSWSKYGSIGYVVCSLGTSYETFAVEFTYTGTFQSSGADVDVAGTDLEIHVGWDSAFTGAQNLTNKVYIKEIKFYEVSEETGPKYETVIDYTGTIGTQENITAIVNEGVVEILPTTFDGGGWASFNKSKYELPSEFSFEVGKTYQLVLTAKADEARTIKASFAAAEASWSNYGSVGYILAELGTDYETFTVDFTYTGKFSKNDTEYDIVYVSLEVQVGWDSAFSGELSLTNKVYIKELSVKELVEEEVGPKYETVIDYTGTIGTQENITAEVNDGVVEILPTTFDGGGWASFNKSKYELPSEFSFEVGKTYQLVLTAKADEARTIKASFAAAESTWTKYGSVGFILAELGTDYETFTVDFTYTGSFIKDSVEYDIVYVSLEIQVGWDSAFSGELSLTNKVYIKELSVKELVEEEPFYGDLVTDLMVSDTTEKHTIENVSVIMDDGIAKINPTDMTNQWASNNKLKYDITEWLQVGSSYQLVLTVKADQARDIKISVGGNYYPNNENLANIICPLGTEYETFVLYLDYTGKTPKDVEVTVVELELQFGKDSAFTGEQTLDNTIYVESFALYEYGGSGDPNQ